MMIEKTFIFDLKSRALRDCARSTKEAGPVVLVILVKL